MRQKKLLFLTLFALGLIVSCSKEDGPSVPSVSPNTAPVIKAQTFVAAENINDTFVIGTVTATDADQDALTFSIATNSENLFEITNAGALSLAAGKTLSFTSKASHVLGISVSDGAASAKADFTINVTEVVANNETPVIEAQSFEVAENILGVDVIGTVTANDPEDDDLTFSIVEDASGLFEITDGGELSLLEGQILDFDTATEHTLTVEVRDGNTAAQAIITINVTEVVVEVNEAPSIEAQFFEAPEDIADDVVIGTVEANDPEDDALTFSIIEDTSELFEITTDGELSLAAGKSLDYEAVTEHTIIVRVTDGINDPLSAEITLTVTDVYESLFDDPESFITIWQTTSPNEAITIGVNGGLMFPYNYNYTIDWGDGTVENIAHSNNPSHVYAGPGAHYVAIKGQFPSIRMSQVSQTNRKKLTRIAQWGSNPWKTMFEAFYYCQNLNSIATDTPSLSVMNSTKSMFEGAENFNADINDWDVSNITNMSRMFYLATSFNQDLSGWNSNTRNVTDMSYMFGGNMDNPTSFNGDISGWNVSSVTTMQSMFAYNTSFNQNLSGWNVNNVEKMRGMFSRASAFNSASLGSWELNSEGVDMAFMLSYSGLSPIKYSLILRGWASNNPPSNIQQLNASGISYCNDQQTINARAFLTSTKNWYIADSGPTQCQGF